MCDRTKKITPYMIEYVIDPPVFHTEIFNVQQQEAKDFSITRENHDFIHCYAIYDKEQSWQVEQFQRQLSFYTDIIQIFNETPYEDMKPVETETKFEMFGTGSMPLTVHIESDSQESLSWFKSKIPLISGVGA